MTRRTFAIVFFAVLIAIAPIAPGGTFRADPMLEAIKALGRPATYAMLVVAGLWAGLVAIATGKAARVGTGCWAYCAFFVFIGLKFLALGFATPAMMYIGAGVLYLMIFGVYLPRRKLDFDLSAAVCSIGLANALIVAMNLPVLGALVSYGGRSAGFAYNANVLAYSCVMTAACVPALAKHTRFGFPIVCALLVGNAAIIAATVSRGALVLLTVTLVTATFHMAGRWRSLVLLISPLLVGAAAIILAPAFASIYSRFFEGRENTRGWVLERQMDRFWDSPLFGSPWEDALIIFGENMYLGVASELGVVGLILLTLICLPLLWRLVHMRRHPDQRAAAVTMLIILTAGLLEAPLLGVVAPGIFIVLILDAAMARERAGRSDQRSRSLRLTAV